MIYCKYMKLKIPCQIFLRRISQSEIRNSAAAESEGGQKFLPPQPPSFLPARAFSLAREARRQFRSKKVRISSNKRTRIKLSGILPTDFAARSASHLLALKKPLSSVFVGDTGLEPVTSYTSSMRSGQLS